MNARYLWNRSTCFAVIAAVSLLPAAVAQIANPTPNEEKPEKTIKLEKYIVTGSMIKRLANEGALPVQTITRQDLEQQGIVSAEQMIMALNINGNGLDNLASNSDVVDGAARGNNGSTSANLRGQGSNATLILLNGRRIASHGLNGGTVDLNQVPFAAIERIEILKDGASAIYGTDAIGGVINFILRTDFTGLVLNTGFDVTQEGGGNIYRASLIGGYGDLNRDKFNIMAALSVTDNKVLRGDQRDFVNTFQPDRGLSPDTRGAPIATIFAISSVYSALSRDNINATGRGTGPIDPANSALRVNGINIVDLPTNTAGYAGLDGMGPYDEVLWSSPASKYGSAWDTGRAAVLQQPVRNTNLVMRGTYKLGEHRLTAEAIIGRSESIKSFSPNQISSSNTTTVGLPDGTRIPNPFLALAYPSTGADYNRVFNALVAYFPALEANRGRPMPFRWRAIPLGNRALQTQSDTHRILLAAEGPLPFFSEWEYRLGASRASSKSKSVLNHGFFYQVPFAALLNNGTLNPFSYTQTPEALTALDAIRADGVKLYGGTFTTDDFDATTSGPLFKLPGGTAMAAVGLDFRIEKYFFAGDLRPDANTAAALVFNAPFDNALATAGTLRRDIKAAFGELQVPVWKGLDLNTAVRTDQYTGFGRTTNPKVTLRYSPSDHILLRGSYSKGFRVPGFKQIFDPRTETTYVGNDIADPSLNNGSLVVDSTHPAIHPLEYGGGNLALQPEDAKMSSLGVVISVNPHLSFNVDWWDVTRDGTIQFLGIKGILANYTLFPDRLIRENGILTAVDARSINAGETRTKGMEFGVRSDTDAFGGKLAGGFDVSYLLEKKSRLIANAPFGPSEIGRFTRASDLGIRWKHTAFVSYRRGNWTGLLSNLYREGYLDAVLPGVASGAVVPPNWNPRVAAYSTFNCSLIYSGLKNMTVIAGIKNILNTDPPFSAAYDTNTGAGSSWEPRVADPRGRAFTLSVEYKFN